MKLAILISLLTIQLALFGRGLWGLYKCGYGFGWFIASACCGPLVTIVIHA